MGFLKGAHKHFWTITRHRHKVIVHCKKAGILWQGLRHDLSKYTPTEFIPGAKYYAGDKSPNVGERKAKGYSAAWLHHKGRNRHHFEYWVDYAYEGGKVIYVEMPYNYLAEMFCDRVAASKIYLGDKYEDGSSLEYYYIAKGRRKINEKTDEELYKLLKMLADEGEDKTFKYIKAKVKEYKAEKHRKK